MIFRLQTTIFRPQTTIFRPQTTIIRPEPISIRLQSRQLPHDDVSKSPRLINEMSSNGHVTSLLIVRGPNVSCDGHP
jgi:hypothetical protein